MIVLLYNLVLVFCIPLRKTEFYIPFHSCILQYVAPDNFNTNPEIGKIVFKVPTFFPLRHVLNDFLKKFFETLSRSLDTDKNLVYYKKAENSVV